MDIARVLPMELEFKKGYGKSSRVSRIRQIMGLKSLLLCSDEKIVRVLRRVLSDLEIEVDLCPNADAALRKLTRERFEAIVADFADEGAMDVLRSARAAPSTTATPDASSSAPGKTVDGIR